MGGREGWEGGREGGVRGREGGREGGKKLPSLGIWSLFFSDSEQDQLFHAAETIQVAFRKYKVQQCNCSTYTVTDKMFVEQTRNQLRNREKSAALLIEKYYKQYREVSSNLAS